MPSASTMPTTSTEDRDIRPVALGPLLIGGGRVAIVAGPSGAGADATWITLRDRCGVRDPRAELGPRSGGPARIAEPFHTADLPVVAEHADAVGIGAARMQDFRLLRAAARLGLPVFVRRSPAATEAEWLAAADYCAAEGNHAVVLCESGSRTAQSPDPVLDLAMVTRVRRAGYPVLADLSAGPQLAAAALGAGADGLLLGAEAVRDDVDRARATAARVAPVVRTERPGTVDAARGAIDRTDALLAILLEQRAELAGTVQRIKPVGGFAGRDPRRERDLVAALARHAPRLGPERLARVMNVVIEAGLDLAEADRRDTDAAVRTAVAVGASYRP